MRGSIDKFAKSARMAGAAMTAIGVVGAAGLGKLVGSYKEQEIGISKLNQALVNVGHTYGDQETAIESVIESIQRKTNFGDEEQRESLRTLITIGGSYAGSLDALKVATDMAAGANMSLEGASLLLGKAIAGETSSLSRYGIKLAEGATQTEIMAALTAQFGGMAEAAVDPLTQLGNRAGDVGQAFGQHLSPFVDAAAKVLERMMDKFSKLDPKWQKAIALIAGLTVGFLLIAGPLLLFIGMLPLLAGGFGMVSAAMGPITLAIVGIAAAIAAGILIWKNWDTIVTFIQKVFESKFAWLLPGGALMKAIFFLKDNWREIWDGIKEKVFDVARFIIPKVESILNVIVGMVNGAIEIAQKLGFMKDVAKFDEFELDAEEMAHSVLLSVEKMAMDSVEKAKEMAQGVKDGMTGAFDAIGEAIDDLTGTTSDATGRLSEEIDYFLEGFEEHIPEALKKTNEALEETQEVVEETIATFKRMEQFSDTLRSGLFQFGIVGGMPMGQGIGSQGQRLDAPFPEADIKGFEQTLMLSVANLRDPKRRVEVFESFERLMLRGQKALEIFPELEQLINRILSEDIFDLGSIARFKERYISVAAARIRDAISGEDDGEPPPVLAHGGIVTRPTLAMIGEAGPEAVVPLSGGRGLGLGPTYNITISDNTVFGEMDFKRLVVNAVTDSHRRGGLPFLGKA
jgi:hypothetical protein